MIPEILQYGKLALPPVDVESLIHPVFVDSLRGYHEMLDEVQEYKRIILDSETVGNSTKTLFSQQADLECQMKALDATMGFGPDIIEGTKAELRKVVLYLKQKYGVKTLTLKTLTDPSDRDWYRQVKREAQAAVMDHTDAVEWLELQKRYDRLQNKINRDTSGLFFYKNTFALLQVGILQKQVDGNYTAKQFLVDGLFLKRMDNVDRARMFQILAHMKWITGHNLKFDLNQWAHHLGWDFSDQPVQIWDTMLQEQVLYGGLGLRNRLQDVTYRYTGYEQNKEEQLSNWLRRPLSLTQEKYACLDVITPGIIHERQIDAMQCFLDEEGFDLRDASRIQRQFLKVLAKMEQNGIYVDIPAVKQEIAYLGGGDIDPQKLDPTALTEDVKAKLSEGEIGRIRVELGQKLSDSYLLKTKDLKSPKETVTILREYGLANNIPALQTIESSSKATFQELQGIDILDEISAYRSLFSTKIRYCQRYVEDAVNSRIHTSFVQLQKEATRSSSTDPNIQNIPRPGRADLPFEQWKGRERLRAYFTPTPGWNLFDADYSGIELCGIAYESQDDTMIQALNEGTSLHALTTMELFGLPNLKEAKKDLEKYNTGKVFNFTVGYGGGVMRLLGLLHQAGIFTQSEADVKELRNRWFALYSRVKPWQNDTLEFVKSHGYITTPSGRRIYFKDPAKIYNEAFNKPIQSMCYEGLQQAGILLMDEIHELERTVLPEKGMIRLVNEVHDEYLVEAKTGINRESVKNLMTRNMIHGIQPMFETKIANGRTYKKVIVRVEAQCVNSWAEKP